MLLSRRKLTLGIVLAALSGGQAARAQSLADRMPSDALLYAGWAGSDAVGPAYNASRLKAFLDTLALPQFLSDRFKESRAGQADQAQDAQFGLDLLSAVAKSPTAIYVGPFDFSVNPAKPVPRIAIISKVGADFAGKAAPKLNASAQQNHKPQDPPTAITAAGDFLLLTVGELDFDKRLAANAPTANLTKLPAFQKAVVQLGPGAAQSPAFVYIDGQAFMQTLVTTAVANPAAQNRELIAPVADGLGLNSLQQIAWAGNFEPADGGAGTGGWQSSTFVGLRDRRVGFMAFLDNPPLSQASLKLIPRSATSAGAFRFDGNRLLADIANTAATVDAAAAQRFETVLHQVYVWTGVDVKRELFPAFGDEFIYYSTPQATGNSVRGFTLVNRLRDARKADSAVSALENYINLMILQRDPNSKVQFQTRQLAAPYQNITAHMLAMDAATPCWAINNNTFFFSLSLPGLQAAMDMAAGRGPSILDNPEFLSLRAKLAPAGSPQEAFSAFSFADLPASFPETYSVVNNLLTTALAKTPAAPQVFTLPPLNRLTPTLTASLNLYWTDAAGFHARETSPFPLSGLLTPTQYLPVVVAQRIRQRQLAAQAAAQTAPAGQSGPTTGAGLP